MTVISRLNQFPVDIVWQIGLRFSAGEFAVLLQVSSTFYQLLTQIYERIARDEREHARIRSAVIPLNAWQIAEQWGQLTPTEARALRIDLRARPFMIYAGIIDPAMVVLQEKFLSVRNTQVALSSLALGHLNLKQAAILASLISDEKIRATTIHAIVKRAIDENLPQSVILEFISNLLTAETPLEKIKKIIKEIPSSDRKKRDTALRALALKNGTEIGKAISIARLIRDPGKQIDTFYDIALKDEIAPKHLASIIKFIPDALDALPFLIEIEKMGYFLNDQGQLIKKKKNK